MKNNCDPYVNGINSLYVLYLFTYWSPEYTFGAFNGKRPSGMDAEDGKENCSGEGDGNPLQCSCLENPTDSGAWWATVHGVTKSQIKLKQLSTGASVIEFSKYEFS